MRNLTLVFIVFLLLLQGCGISGFMLSDRGQYFHTTICENFKEKKIEKIAVFVYSNGKNDEYSTYSISKSYYPPKITKELVYNPDSTNSGPSMELALQIVDEFKEKGYYAKDIQELGHHGEIKYKNIIDVAKKQGFDAAFIVYYTGVNKRLFYYSYNYGYLYLPNAALFSTKNDELLWSTQFYGLVEKAHYLNFSGQGFNTVIMEVVNDFGDVTYPSAAKKAKDVLFKPKYFPKSYIEIPSIAQKKMKI
jgi:hypothetical protein